MAGTANTTDFVIGSATVMLGQFGKSRELVPASHSIGLVKNFTLSADAQYTTLTQGRTNSIVHSSLTQNTLRATMEVYEATAQNLTYGLGLDGSTIVKKTATSTVDGPVTGDGSTTTTFDVALGDGSKFSPGDYVLIDNDGDDNVVVRRVTSVSTDTITVDKAFAVGQNLVDGATVKVVNAIRAGQQSEQPYLSAFVVGKLANDEQVGLLIPKVRIERGFQIAFNDQDYGNLPFELAVYDLVSTDSEYAWYNGASVKVLRT